MGTGTTKNRMEYQQKIAWGQLTLQLIDKKMEISNPENKAD